MLKKCKLNQKRWIKNKYTRPDSVNNSSNSSRFLRCENKCNILLFIQCTENLIIQNHRNGMWMALSPHHCQYCRHQSTTINKSIPFRMPCCYAIWVCFVCVCFFSSLLKFVTLQLALKLVEFGLNESTIQSIIVSSDMMSSNRIHNTELKYRYSYWICITIRFAVDGVALWMCWMFVAVAVAGLLWLGLFHVYFRVVWTIFCKSVSWLVLIFLLHGIIYKIDPIGSQQLDNIRDFLWEMFPLQNDY